MERSFEGSSVVVAGATGGIGSRVAARLAGRGARLTLVSRSRERLDDLDAAGTPAVADLREADGAAAVVATALEAHGRIDGVVNAAGVVAFGSIEDTDVAVLEDVFRTNLLAPLYLARAALPHLGKGGFLATVSAVVAEQPTAGMVLYSASKAAVTAADAALHRELRRRGVDVIDLRPPHTETGLAGRPVAGVAPKLPRGLDPDAVADRIVLAIEHGEREVASGDFA